MRETKNKTFTLTGSRTRWAMLRDVVSWYEATNKVKIFTPNLAKALMKSTRTQRSSIVIGKDRISLYRIGK